jgi:hypothetical protein
MIYDRDRLWSELAKEDLEEIRKKHQMGIYAPRAKADLVKAFIEKADADLDRISRAVPPQVHVDAFGRDLAAEERAFRADLIRPASTQWMAGLRHAAQPLKHMMERWLGEQNRSQ